MQKLRATQGVSRVVDTEDISGSALPKIIFVCGRNWSVKHWQYSLSTIFQVEFPQNFLILFWPYPTDLWAFSSLWQKEQSSGENVLEWSWNYSPWLLSSLETQYEKCSMISVWNLFLWKGGKLLRLQESVLIIWNSFFNCEFLLHINSTPKQSYESGE